MQPARADPCLPALQSRILAHQQLLRRVESQLAEQGALARRSSARPEPPADAAPALAELCSSDSDSLPEPEPRLVAELLGSLEPRLFDPRVRAAVDKPYDSLHLFFSDLVSALRRFNGMREQLGFRLPHEFLSSCELPKATARELLAAVFNQEQQGDFEALVRNFLLNVYDYLFSPMQLLLLLIQLFHAQQEEKLAKLFQARVVGFFRLWIGRRAEEFKRQRLLAHLLSFFLNSGAQSLRLGRADPRLQELVAAVLRLTYSSVVSPGSSPNKPAPLSRSCSCNPPTQPAHKKAFDLFEETRFKRDVSNRSDMVRRIFEEDAATLAQMLFCIDASCFGRLCFFDLHAESIARRQSADFRAYIFRLNAFTNFLVYLLLKLDSASERRAMIHKYCRVMQLLSTAEFVDYEALWMLYHCFEQIGFKFIKRSTQEQPDSELEKLFSATYSHHKALFAEGFAAFQQVFDCPAEKPCVPNLLGFTHRIVKINEGWSHRAAPAVDFHRLLEVNSCVNSFVEFQARLDRGVLGRPRSLRNDKLLAFLRRDFVQLLRADMELEGLDDDEFLKCVAHKLIGMAKSL